MKGSITFKFGGGPDDYRVHISREGELDSGDLQVIAAVLNEGIMLKKIDELEEVKRDCQDLFDEAQRRNTWKN